MMFKKLIMLGTCVLFSQAAMAGWDIFETPTIDGRTVIVAKVKDIHIDSVPPEGATELQKFIAAKEFKKGLPSSDEEAFTRWFKNQNVNRQIAGNLYHTLAVSRKEETLGYLHFGRMPVVDYDPDEHAAVIAKWKSLEVGIEEGEEESSSTSASKGPEYGLAMMLPILRDDLSAEEVRSCLSAGVDYASQLCTIRSPLPVDKLQPRHLIGLYALDDPLLEFLKEVGFKIDLHKGKGYQEFYPPKWRALAHLELEQPIEEKDDVKDE